MQLEHHPKSNLSVEAPTTQAWPPKRGDNLNKYEVQHSSSLKQRTDKPRAI